MYLDPSDRNAIEDLIVDYCLFLDRMNLQALAALFVEDCVVSYGPDMETRGRGALQTALGRLWRWRRTAHHLANVRIRADGVNTVTGESYVMAWHEAPSGATATVFGRYLDRFEWTTSGWRISVRRMEMNGSDAGFTLPLHHAPRNEPPEGWMRPTEFD